MKKKDRKEIYVMKDWFSAEIRNKYAKTVSLYRNKGDETPAFSVSYAGDYRIPVGRLLIAAAIAAGTLLFAAVAAELDRTDKKYGRSKK